MFALVISFVLGLIMGGATVWAWYAFHARGAPDKRKADEAEEEVVYCSSGYDVRFTLNTPAMWRCEDCGDPTITRRNRQRHTERCLSNKKRFVETPLTFVAAPPATVR